MLQARFFGIIPILLLIILLTPVRCPFLQNC
nr:MAG TPA: hypothetical protein [Caudoviricetes sp.]